MHVSPSNKRYIGLTSQKPEHRWNNGKGYKNNKYFYRAIEKYDWDNFEHIIIAKGLTEDEAKWLEIELIRVWDTTNKDKGYNLTKGGDGCNGYEHSEEAKRKMSKSHKGKHTGELNSMFGMKGELNPMFGKQHSEETKKKISETNKGNNYFKGKQHTEETKQKMSENHWDCSGKNNPNAKKIILLNTKEIFLTIKEGAEKYNCNKGCVSQCCIGNRKSAGKHPITGEKLVWMYYKDYLKIIKEMEI